MTTPKPLQAVHTPRRFLSDISNGATASRAPLCSNRDNTPVRGSGSLLDNRNGKRGTFGAGGFIAPKAHGDLSNVRPKSPPLYNLSAPLGGLQIDGHPTQCPPLPHNCYVDDSHGVCLEQDLRAMLRDCCAQDTTVFSSPLAARSKQWSRSEDELEPTERGSRQYARTPRYSLGSPLVPSRLRKRRTHTIEILSDTPQVDVRGLSLGYASALDLYRPVIRAYPVEDGRAARSATTLDYLKLRPPVEHIDVCTTWKGLSLTEAELLFQLNQIFKTCLENLIADQLEEQDQGFRQQQPRSVTNVVGSSVTSTFCSRSVFSRTELSESMVRLLQSSQEYILDFQTSDLKKLLPFYLTSCDYLVDIERSGSQDTALDLRFQYSQPLLPEGPPKLAVEAGWSPDFLTFEQLVIVPREGHELRIIPMYNSNAVFRIVGHHTDLRYSLETPLPWLTWDDHIQGFKGIVPMYSEIRGIESRFGKVYRPGRVGPHAIVNQLRIEIKAVFTECYQPSLRLERTVRTRLTLRVIPWYTLDSAIAPDDELVRPITPGSTRRYVDDLFVCGVSEQIDPRRIPAAQVQIRRVTGLSSLLGGDDLSGIGLSSPASSGRPSTCRFDSAGNYIPGLQPHEEEAISVEVSNQSSLETCSDMTSSIDASDKAEELSCPTRESTGYYSQSLKLVTDSLTSSNVSLGYEEDGSVFSEISTGSPPIIFHNRYSPLRGSKEHINGRSDGGGDESSIFSSVSSASAMSPSERSLLHVYARKCIQYKQCQPKKKTESGRYTWPEDIFLDSGGVAVSVDEIDLL